MVISLPGPAEPLTNVKNHMLFRIGLRPRLRSLILWFAGVMVPVSCIAQPLDIDLAVDLRKFQDGYGLALSPDGRRLAAAICRRTDLAIDRENRQRRIVQELAQRSGCEVSVTDIATGASETISTKGQNAWAPVWSPSGGALAYYGSAGGEVRLYIWDVGSSIGKAVSPQLLNPGAREKAVWSKTGDRLLVRLPIAPQDRRAESLLASGSGAVTVLISGDDTDAEQGTAGQGRPRALDIGQLGIISLRDGTIARLTDAAAGPWYQFHPQDQSVLFLRPESNYDGNVTNFSLLSANIGTEQLFEIASNLMLNPLYSVISLSPDGSYAGYISGTRYASGDLQEAGYSVRGDLYVAQLDGGGIKRYSGAVPDSFSHFRPFVWTPDGSDILVSDNTYIWQASVKSGAMEKVAENPIGGPIGFVEATGSNVAWSNATSSSVFLYGLNSSSKDFEVFEFLLAPRRFKLRHRSAQWIDMTQPLVGAAGEGVATFIAQSENAPPDAWVTRDYFSSSKSVTSLNAKIDANNLGKSALITFIDGDGDRLRATLLKPAGYRAEIRYPLVVRIYPGSLGSELLHYTSWSNPQHNIQMLSSRGYLVLQPDIPLDSGEIKSDLLKSVLPAIDRVVDLGYADPRKIAIMGQSFGAYGTLSLITQSDRFEAAIATAGFADVAGLYGSMTDTFEAPFMNFFERGPLALGVPPWENPSLYIENSPLYSLDKIQTPIMMVSGAADEHITIANDAIFASLRRLNKSATYVRYEGEGHFIETPSNIKDYWLRVSQFLEERLK